MSGPVPSYQGLSDTTASAGLGLREEEAHGFEEGNAAEFDEEDDGFAGVAGVGADPCGGAAFLPHSLCPSAERNRCVRFLNHGWTWMNTDLWGTAGFIYRRQGREGRDYAEGRHSCRTGWGSELNLEGRSLENHRRSNG